MSFWKQIQIIDATGNLAEITPYGEQHIVEPVRIAGGVFNDSVLDPSFYAATNANGGTATVLNTVLTAATNTTANGASAVQTVQAGRFIGGTSNRFYGRISLGDTGTVNNIREWGVRGPGATNGIYFKLNGTAALVAATMKTGVETTYALTFPAGFSLTNLNLYEIDYNSGSVYFIINGTVVYTLNATAPYIGNFQLFAFLSNTNSASSTTNVTASALQLTIYRLGKIVTQSIAGRITTAATTTFKQGPGLLHRITLNDPGGTLITIYDNTAGSGTTLAVINTPAQANPVTLQYGIQFSTGLTVVSTGTWDATIVFE